jgi:hypothetical protein
MCFSTSHLIIPLTDDHYHTTAQKFVLSIPCKVMRYKHIRRLFACPPYSCLFFFSVGLHDGEQVNVAVHTNSPSPSYLLSKLHVNTMLFKLVSVLVAFTLKLRKNVRLFPPPASSRHLFSLVE